MFTGIVEEIGQVQEASPHRLVIAAKTVLSDLRVSQSIAVNGACLTAVEVTPEGFAVDLTEETSRRTNLGFLKQGHHVNLERALAASDRMGGHFVQGHVDGVGVVVAISGPEVDQTLYVEAPEEVARYMVEKGFISVDGISLTVTSVLATTFTVAVIPYTLQQTVLQYRKAGDPVNLEVDILAKYVERLQAR
ncbi:MAG: riboflavin synthase [Chloroflexi bacterium]|nr:riboflavin synthase [Chloroflexota bacterium]